MTGPHGHIQYDGNGEFLLGENKLPKKVNKIGMIAGGTGITPMFQLIQKITSTRDRTGVSLIYCTKFIEDIAFCEDLVNYDRSGRASFYPVVETPNASKWLYGTGKVSEEMIENYMPSPKGKLIL
jgi:cytochrome-b5 reductase